MKSPKITVLFILMEFAPVNTTGNFRSLKFIKYLHLFDINPVIITFKEKEGAKYFNSKIDNSLLHDIPKGTPIYRIHCEDDEKYFNTRWKSFFTIYFSIKDTFAQRWRKFLFAELDAIIQNHHPQVVFTSLPPFSAGMLAVEISKKYKLPLIVDMRDLYARWGNTPFGSKIHYWLTLLEERRIFTYAQSIIAVTPQLVGIFQTLHPGIQRDKFHVIPNGFDSVNELQPDFEFVANKKKVVIGYVGSFYYDPETREQILKPWWKRRGHKMLMYTPKAEDWLYRSPYFFFRTISGLLHDLPHYKEIISIEFVGDTPKWLMEMVTEFGLESNVRFHGFVSHEDSKIIQKGFDLMLATSEKVEREEHYSLPSKIFDYVVQSKPIIGFVTEGIQKDFIVNSGVGIVCDPDETKVAVKRIADLLRRGMRFKVNNQFLESYRRRNLAQTLALLIRTNLSEDKDGKKQ